MIVVRGKRELLEVVFALGATGRLARRLHGGQQQGDDRDHHQQLDERESPTSEILEWKHHVTAPSETRKRKRNGGIPPKYARSAAREWKPETAADRRNVTHSDISEASYLCNDLP